MTPLLARQPAADRVFERLYHRHAADVYRYALALLRNPQDAEDVLQSTFENAYRALARGERPASPRSWLIAIALNVCRVRWRTASRRPREVPLDERPLAAREDERPDLDEVLTALARLPLEQRAAIVLREVEGRSYAEIAQTLGVSLSAVETLIFRARQKLRMRRDALRVTLGAAPLPASLSSLPSGAVATTAGLQLALKGVAAIAVGTLVAGGTYRTVQAVASPDPSPPTVQRPAPVVHHARASRAAPRAARRPGKVEASRRAHSASDARAQPVHRSDPSRPHTIIEPVATKPSAEPAGAPAPSSSSDPVQTVVAALPVEVSTPTVPVSVPAAPPLPDLPEAPALPSVPPPPPLP